METFLKLLWQFLVDFDTVCFKWKCSWCSIILWGGILEFKLLFPKFDFEIGLKKIHLWKLFSVGLTIFQWISMQFVLNERNNVLYIIFIYLIRLFIHKFLSEMLLKHLDIMQSLI